MAELKTLKDLTTKQIRLNFDKKPCKEEDDFANCGGCGRFVLEEGCTCSLVSLKKLKQEAIKWIKQDIEDYKKHLKLILDGKKIISYTMSLMNKWKERFNITEEDLK